MLSMEHALEQAAAFLARDCDDWDPSAMRLMPEAAYTEGGRAVVPYNSIAHLDEGQERAWLLGNMPVVVDLTTGVCRRMTVDEVLDGLKNADDFE